jgi:PAS domain S-box-containing protein
MFLQPQLSDYIFKILFEQSADAQLLLKGDVFLECNQAAVDILGAKSRAEIIGLTPWHVSPPKQPDGLSSREKGLAMIGRAETGDSTRFEWQHIRLDGTEIMVEVSLTPLNLNDDLLIHVVFHDITERHRLFRELKKAKEQAVESDRLKSAFLANMSHEIRTPMNSILGFAELLGEDDLESDERKQYLEIIQAGTNHLLSIISDIIDISKIEAGQVLLFPKPISLNNLFTELHATFTMELTRLGKKDIQLNRTCSCQLSDRTLLVDSGRLRQIMVNLLSNAIKFTDRGSIEFGCTNESDRVRFFVTDTGRGISPAYQKIIFERFRQVEETLTRNHTGTGLGLTICKGLITLMGGRIGVNSNPGEGSEFWFTLPAFADSDPASQQPR